MKSLLSKGYLLLIYALLYLPILILIIYSFNKARFSLQWHGFSLQWYKELIQDTGLWQAFFHSVFLGLSASLVATVFGLLVCVRIFLYKNTAKRTLFIMLLLLIIIPDLVLGVALLIFFNVADISLGFLSLLIAHITFCIPFVILTISTRIQTLDANVYFSALDLGASKSTALLKILLPLLWPAILSAFLLCFTLSFDDVIISYFVAGPDFSILPLTIFSLVRTGVTPELNALCTFTFAISMLLVIISHYLSGKDS
ncbi:ABC transporter permease subunit [Legionella israelensis]|uniref:ABC transporter permease subunit n=1 Tax=Legionella israelensis TaxID=454 RepID=A0A0W0WS39_9GAMM|nr:ABC transporter permease subunit [Legionella israelensis]KTD35138.1 spermidine/putrescine ABC transporter permease PotC [Legionella israelensis]QBR84427.1 ABC transporter permease subunit [Legionella israelensis]QBS08705.1 ABC transporter permease subunit [Legionella israelensis]QDP72464.1 ABC transporter permease subunit [Legionella israelensis]SCY01210.1 spermidine/putrescine transport system permease protein [Legionella israelensis DSM 19235]